MVDAASRSGFDDLNVSGVKAYEIVSRAGFGTVQRDEFQAVPSYRYAYCGSMRPRWAAILAASVRLAASSLARMELT